MLGVVNARVERSFEFVFDRKVSAVSAQFFYDSRTGVEVEVIGFEPNRVGANAFPKTWMILSGFIYLGSHHETFVSRWYVHLGPQRAKVVVR